MEGFVVNEIIKQIEYDSLPWKLSYLRNKSGMEIDWILSCGSEKVACEIKAAKRVAGGDFKSPVTLMEMDPDVRHGILFSRQPIPLALAKNITHFPLWNL